VEDAAVVDEEEEEQSPPVLAELEQLIVEDAVEHQEVVTKDKS